MDIAQLTERIQSLDVSTIKRMSPDGLATLTNTFKEPLVMELMFRATTNSQQRELFNAVKAAYKKWMKTNEPMWGELFGERYPEFMDQLQLDIECGMIVTKDGAVPAPVPDMVPADTTTQVLNTMVSPPKTTIPSQIREIQRRRSDFWFQYSNGLISSKTTGEESAQAVQPQKTKETKKRTKKEEKKAVPHKGPHKAFPFISKDGGDAYHMAQVVDLFNFMKKTKAEGGPMLIVADQRAFVNNFTTGNTSSTILWLGSKRELHYIVSEWKQRGYIKFSSDDDIWVITSRVFFYGKGVKKDGQPTPFDSDDLGSTHNPTNITQDLEDIVEILNPEKPSKNYERYAQKNEARIDFKSKPKGKNSYQAEDDDPLGIRESYEEETGYCQFNANLYYQSTHFC